VTGDYTVNVKATSPENALQIAKRICNDTADFGELYDENLTVKSIAYIDEHGDKHTV
jgi:hypothetical protein